MALAAGIKLGPWPRLGSARHLRASVKLTQKVQNFGLFALTSFLAARNVK